MADIRQLVTEDRGVLKKIQAFFPGYRTYRNCEDLRSADNMLRMELARRLETVERHITKARREIGSSINFDLITRIGELVNLSHKVTEKVRHAEQGYSPWISGDVRIQEDELSALYDYDLSMLTHIDGLLKESEALENATYDKSPDIADKIRGMKRSIDSFERLFAERIAKVTKVAQK